MADFLVDGLYAIYFGPLKSADMDCSEVRGALRGGKFLGADKFGGVFEGELMSGMDAGVYRAAGQLSVPAGGRLITGGDVVTEATLLKFDVELEKTQSGLVGSLEVADRFVDIQVVRVGDLPT